MAGYNDLPAEIKIYILTLAIAASRGLARGIHLDHRPDHVPHPHRLLRSADRKRKPVVSLGPILGHVRPQGRDVRLPRHIIARICFFASLRESQSVFGLQGEWHVPEAPYGDTDTVFALSHDPSTFGSAPSKMPWPCFWPTQSSYRDFFIAEEWKVSHAALFAAGLRRLNRHTRSLVPAAVKARLRDLHRLHRQLRLEVDRVAAQQMPHVQITWSQASRHWLREVGIPSEALRMQLSVVSQQLSDFQELK